jgi:predicted nucleic acid-binding protein
MASTGPDRAYLDTCVFSALAKGELSSNDSRAFIGIAGLVQESRVTLFSSTVAQQELDAIPRDYRGPHLEQYSSVAKVQSRITWLDDRDGTVQEDPLFRKIRGILPDENDARHLAHAKLAGVDNVITVDKRTILRYKPELEEQVGIRVYTPTEYFARLSHDTST